MQEFDHIEALWAKHTVDIKISSDDMLKQAKREVNSIRNKSLMNIFGMALSFLAIASLWFFDFNSWTTHLGIGIIALAVAVYTIILYNNYQLLSKKDFTANPQEFIAQLKLYQIKRSALYQNLYWFYAIALSLGTALYFVEILAHLSLWLQAVVLIVSFGWMIFCSTLVRKAVLAKDKERIALLIEKFTRISEQFKAQ